MSNDGWTFIAVLAVIGVVGGIVGVASVLTVKAIIDALISRRRTKAIRKRIRNDR